KILEKMRGELKQESHRQSFFESKMGVYKSMVRVCLKLDKVREAYEYVERSKSRVFIDLLAIQQIFSESVDPKLIEREKELYFKIIALKSKLEGEDKGIVGSREVRVRSVESEESLQRELAQTEAEYSEVLKEIKEKDPEYGSLKTVFTLPIEEIQEMVKNLEDCILLEYYVTDEKVMVFILDGETIKVEEIEIASRKLYERVSSFLEKISDPIIKPHIVKSASKALYDLLFSPLDKYIKEKKLVYIVPHSILHNLPFSALSDGEEYLVQKSYTLALCPSGTVLHFCFEKEKGKKLETCLAVGNPSKDLKFAEEEARYVASLFSTELLLTDLAIKERVINGVEKCNIFHFAGHGYFNEYNPVYSFLKLAGEEKITVGETFNLNLKMASLVNLSACESGLSEISEGDELIGLIRGFIFAGSPSVVASLWQVDDKSTGELMKEFYEKCKNGINKAYALKSAKQSILKKYEHPYYWAAFELNGSYGNSI
ncbi:MAG: CHAT domain-containing protein, partial [Methanosarcinales archaeon]